MQTEQTYIPESIDETTRHKWIEIQFAIKKQFGKKPDLNGVLFIIGMQELGQLRTYSKEEKMDLMHIATCRILSASGYYKFTGRDADGWPQWELQKALPAYDLLSQEVFLKKHVVKYFEDEQIPLNP